MLHARPDYNQRFIDVTGSIPPTEPVFMLRAQDATAADTVAYWVERNRELSADPKLIAYAEAHVAKMRAWPVKKVADAAAVPPSKPGKPHPEKILGITRDNLERIYGGPLWHGLARLNTSLADVADASELRARDEVEDDPSFKQIIPYTFFVWSPDSGEDMVFSYERGSGGGESRLHAKRSLGVGGHIEESDGEPGDVHRLYQRARRREIEEEVAGEFVICDDDGSCGFLNDDSNPVGSVHLGVVHKIRVRTPRITSKEGDSLINPAFASASLLPSMRWQFETWSQLVIDALWPR